MRLATWNVNHVRKRLPQLLAWLAATQPDVVALQELKATEAQFPRAELEAAGYGALVVAEPTWNGVALLARGAPPIAVRRSLPGDPTDRQARYLEAAVHGVLVGALYLPNGNPWPGPKFDHKVAWFERLIAHAQGLVDSGHPVVLAGDFNVVPTDADCASPASWQDNALLHPGPRAAWARLLQQGWLDALPAAQPATQPGVTPWTFWDYRRNRWPRDSGLRIGHILLNPKLAPTLRAAGVDRALRGLPEPSDHAPVWVELAF